MTIDRIVSPTEVLTSHTGVNGLVQSALDRIVRPAEASTITGRSLASMWRDEQTGTFPSKIRLGANSVGYRLSSLLTWMDSLETVNAANVKIVAPGSRRGRKPAAVVGA